MATSICIDAAECRLRDAGYVPQRWIDPAGTVWRDLVDPRDELVVVVYGRLRVWIVGVPHDLSPGDDIRIPAGAVHGSEVLGDQDVQLVFGYPG